MKKHSIIISLITILQLINNCCYGQLVAVYKNDSLFNTIIDSNKKTFFVNSFHYKLKDKLPSGTYIIYNTNRVKGNKSLSAFILFKGTFKDSLREGVFEFYDENYKGKPSKLILKETYKNGILHGSYIEYNSSGKYYEGFYQNGKKDGFFITYNDGKVISSIAYYKNDIKKNSATYKNNILYSTENELLDNKLEQKIFYPNGNIYAYLLYENNKPIRMSEYYEDGIIKSDKIGEFLNTATDIQFSLEVILSKPIYKGKTTLFDTKGNITSEVIKE